MKYIKQFLIPMLLLIVTMSILQSYNTENIKVDNSSTLIYYLIILFTFGISFIYFIYNSLDFLAKNLIGKIIPNTFQQKIDMKLNSLNFTKIQKMRYVLAFDVIILIGFIAFIYYAYSDGNVFLMSIIILLSVLLSIYYGIPAILSIFAFLLKSLFYLITFRPSKIKELLENEFSFKNVGEIKSNRDFIMRD
ncbi:MAG: hypothetical protein JXR48_02955 [Candidatus Delongbacteria bacterium]|nr:hypothetical protein [Candidatus Delongbacteria bacterium]MBN2833907.1 hypothetical protein [Candidatus Delongbacteria bacterium]